MYRLLDTRLSRLADEAPRDLLSASLKGLEKESLRVDAQGYLSQRPHPATLGSPLTHGAITTDYSEALIELITPPFADIGETLAHLHDLHGFVYANIDDELLWATSMPCMVTGDEGVPIARYGSSNRGLMRHIYRRGLGWRYGRVMQTIAGVHFNYSFPQAFWQALAAVDGADAADRDFVSAGYFALIRNFQRYGWLISWLFGASPAVCRSFLRGRDDAGLDAFDRGTLYKPYATSLRMSDIGYKNKTQAQLRVGYDDIDAYVASLGAAITTPHPPYQEIGVEVDGEWRQLNANILQIENEFYSLIRPKQIAGPGERPTVALSRRGVRYVEVRALDVAAYDPLGVNEAQLRFVETLLVFCVLAESPPLTADERRLNERNQTDVASEGRNPALTLEMDGRRQGVAAWARELVERMLPCARLLDRADGGRYREALEQQLAVIADPSRLPSARMVEEMRQRDETFFALAMRMSRAHKAEALASPPAAARIAELEAEARQSLAEQAAIETEPQEPFRDFLARYFEAG